MSGGSYNYLCYATLCEQVDDLRKMRDRLRELRLDQSVRGGRRELAMTYKYAELQTQMILDAMNVPKALADIWHAVEWRDSGDWGQDQLESSVLEAMQWPM